MQIKKFQSGVLLFGLVLLSSLCLSLSAEAKVVFSHDFENAPAVEKLQKESETGGILSQAASYAHAGKYGLQASPNLSGSSQVQFYIPPDLPQGVLTFWIYDPLFEGPTVGQNFKPGFMVICLKQDKPGKVYSNFYLDTGRESPYWWLSTCDDTPPQEGVCTNALRHPGWTRVDFVNPGGNDPRNFIIYIDGREAARTWNKYLALNRVIVRGKFKRTYLAPGRKNLKVKYANGYTTVEVPRLDTHLMVAAEEA